MNAHLSNTSHRWVRPVARLMAFLLANMYVPYYAFALPGQVEAAPVAPDAQSRPLTRAELSELRGQRITDAYGNPYNSGQAKYDVVYKGVNTRTGDFGMSATDISFEGGFGIPVSVTRSYSSNSLEVGPLGPGWTFGLDLRSSAGGLLKSPGAPVRSTPVRMKRRPVNQATVEPIAGQEPVDAFLAQDAGGTEETVERDVDGILTPPGWDANVYEGANWVFAHGQWDLQGVTVITPEGTRNRYETRGEYVGGTQDWRTGIALPNSRSSVLKLVESKDRHGNVVEYHYDEQEGQFETANGLETSRLLSWVKSAEGRYLKLFWAQKDAGDPQSWRVTKIDVLGADPGTSPPPMATVQYGYSAQAPYRLTSVTTPGGKTTTYGYGQALVSTDEDTYVPGGAPTLLTSVTDPRGLTTTIEYVAYGSWLEVPNTPSQFVRAVVVANLVAPGGQKTSFSTNVVGYPNWTEPAGSLFSPNQGAWFFDLSGRTCLESTSGLPADIYAQRSVQYLQGSPAGTVNTVVHAYNRATVGQPNKPQDTVTSRTYDATSLALINEVTTVNEKAFVLRSESAKTYNFLGAPLSEVTFEGPLGAPVRRTETEYAYWGQDKYFQQRAVRTRFFGPGALGNGTPWRYSHTDYYTSSETGNGAARGMTKEVRDAKYGQITADPGAEWRSSVALGSGSLESARFKYDSQGRPVEVEKLIANGPPATYSKTTTTYQGHGAPAFGAASSVTEAAGTAIARTTSTLAWHWSGKATTTVDAMGRKFVSNYDLDGQVTSVQKEVAPGNLTTLLSYTYGTLGVENGQLLQVDDTVGGVRQTFGYVPQGQPAVPATGQVAWTAEAPIGGPSTTNRNYRVDYEYDPLTGDKTSDTVRVTADTVRRYRTDYRDYTTVGGPDGPVRVFRTMDYRLAVDGTTDFVETGDRYWYHYAPSGRLLDVDFAAQPRSGQAYLPGWDDSGQAGPFGAERAKALSFVHADYTYDSGGRPTRIEYARYSTQDNGQTYAKANLRAYGAAYTLPWGLKSAVDVEAGNGQAWAPTARGQAFAYEAERDFLTGVTYESGSGWGSGATWSYGPTGNRSDATCDALDRMTASAGGFVYENDALGNRLWRDRTNNRPATAQKMTWDDLGRAASVQGTQAGARYRYRADGMRAVKVTGLTLGYDVTEEGQVSGYYDALSTDMPTTRFYYNGQMPADEDLTYRPAPGAPLRLEDTAYAVGARGVERTLVRDKALVGGSWATVDDGYTLYDTHGNGVGKVRRSDFTPPGGQTVPAYTPVGERDFDPWGVPLAGSQPGPQQGYCANLGHRQDPESGLVYMRARYYEPGTGRFVSEDPARDGGNWFVYAGNNPSNLADPDGRRASFSWVSLLLSNGIDGFIRWVETFTAYDVNDSLELVVKIKQAYDNLRGLNEARKLALMASGVAYGSAGAAATGGQLGLSAAFLTAGAALRVGSIMAKIAMFMVISNLILDVFLYSIGEEL